MKRITFILCMLAACTLQAPAEKVSAEEHKANIKTLAELKRVGWYTEIKVEAHEVIVDPYKWKQLTYKQKGGFTMIVSEFIEYQTDLGHVTVRCSMTNKKLGSLGSIRGFRVYD